MGVLARSFGVADIFVSCTSSDREWAEWIGHELIKLGHAPRLHDWEIKSGDDIMAWMVERHHLADFVIRRAARRALIASNAHDRGAVAEPIDISPWSKTSSRWP
jgi:hypothetical protein